MKKIVKKYVAFTGEKMATEYASTMEIIRREFSDLDKLVLDTLNRLEGEKEVEDILEELCPILENFKNSMEKMIDERLKEIIQNKRAEFVGKMTALTITKENPIESLMVIGELMEVTQQSFETYEEMCKRYVAGRLCALMDAVEERLGIREEMEELENLIHGLNNVDTLEDLIEMLKQMQ